MSTVVKIYQANGPVVTVTLDTGFPAKLLYDQPVGGRTIPVYRIDFYDPTDDSSPLLIVPCADASATKFSRGGDSLELNLQLTVLVGNLSNRSMQGAILCDPNANLVFEGGLFIAGRWVNPDNVGGAVTNTPYLATLFQLTSPGTNGPTTAPVNSADIAPFGEGWEQFDFRTETIAFQAHPFVAGKVIYSVLTLDRAIKATDDFDNLRFLPPPFSIAVAASVSAARQSTILAVQRPADAWLAGFVGVPTEWVIDISGFSAPTMADFWRQAVVERYAGALRSVDDGLPVSLLPGFEADAAEANWRLNLALSTVSGTPAASSVNASSLRLLGVLGSTKPDTTPALKMACYGFRDDSGDALSFTAVLQDNPPSPTSNPSLAPWMGFQTSGDFGLVSSGRVRVGSIDLVMDPTPPASSTAIQCHVDFEQLAKPKPNTNRKGFWIPRLTLTGTTTLRDLVPGAQDEPADPQAASAADAGDPKDYSREDPLVVVVSDTSQKSQFVLNWREATSKQQNQQLTLTVNASNPNGAPIDVLVIDRNPFMVARAELPSLASAASDANATVALWSNSFSDGPGWRISAGAGSFQLSLPPQGAGEAMVKDTSLTTGQNPWLTPFLLTPQLQATLQSTAELQRFAEPPWNLRRILGYPGQRAPGALVSELEFEMLYGLTCNVNAPNLHLSELFSRLGGFAGPLIDSTTGTLALNYLKLGYTSSQAAQFDTLNQSWGQIYRQLLSRLGVFELWNQETAHDLVLTEGVTYDLRADADQTFPGGIRQGFDSPNVFQALQNNPHSTSAALANPRFTALGGYSKQRAAFSNDLIIVETEHAMGSLESMSVTLIGRIGNLWHHAKHVTVFERSVQPSRQFYLEQPQLTGRPILRKTKEYVEIAQKSRAYPESGGGGIACGFLKGAEFKSIRINVDSAWGADIGKGWMVPLWRRDAQPSDIYPRPHVLLELAVDPATGNDSRMCEILDPEKLCFYTDPSQPASNTDSWPAVAFIDFTNTPAWRSTSEVTPQVNRDYTVEPGFGRYTYQVSTDASQVNVVSQRAGNAISSALTNVTFMRAQSGLKPPDPNSFQVKAGQLHDFMHNALDQLVSAALANPGDAKNQILQRLTVIDSDLVQPYRTAVGVLQNATVPSVCGALGNAAGNVIARAAAPLQTLWQSLFTTLQSTLDGVAFNTPAGLPDTLAQALIAELDEAVMALQTAMGPLLSDLTAAANMVTNLGTAASNLSNKLTDLEGQISDAALGAAGSDFRTNCQNFLAHYRKDFDAALANVEQLLASAGYLFGVRVASSGSVKIQQMRDDLGALESAFNAALSTALTDLNAAFTATIKPDLDAVIGLLAAGASAIKAVSDDLTQLQGLLSDLSGAGPTLANPFVAAIAAIRTALSNAIGSVPAPFNPADYKIAIDNALSTLAKGAQDFELLVAQTQAAVSQQVSLTCSKVLGTLSSAAGSVLNLLGTDLTTFLDTVTTDFAGALENQRTEYISQLDGVLQQAQDAAATLQQDAGSVVDSGLSLLRAFGAPPAVPTLDFNLKGLSDVNPAIAYFFDGVAKEVGLSTGLTSLVKQASSAIAELSQLGLNLPTTSLLDRLVPGDLTTLPISDLLPHIAGLDLSSLFGGITVPAAARDNIIVSHNIDPQTLRGSLDVTLKFPLSGPATLFSIGPATISLDACVFQAAVHVAGGVGQALTRTSSGSISADWHVQIGGTEIVTFVNTALTFDEAGHLHFAISPERVCLASVLQFLADFLQALDLGDGFSLNLLPSGVQCILNLPFPDMSFGAFGISNLSLGSVFELDVSSGLTLSVSANLGRQEAPFTLTIFILGGAGWFEGTVTYPIGGTLTADVSIGILAAASLSISLGPISGGVYVYFGITVEYHSVGGLTLAILLMMQGRVSLLGILDIDIALLLEAEYTSGGGLIGRGQVSVSIKICWCFTLDVHANVEYTFGNSSPGLHAAHLAALAPPPGPAPQWFASAVAQRINYLT